MILSTGKKIFFIIYPAILVYGAWYFVPMLVKDTLQPGHPDMGLLSHPAEKDGLTLFEQNCAYCHGPKGRGNGPADLTIKARSFGIDKFKFATTMNGIPTDQNLTDIIKHGIPGSAMPSFDHLPENDIKQLIEQVRIFAREGEYLKVENKQKKEDDYDPVSLQKHIEKLQTPGDLLPIPPFTPETPESLEKGKKIYMTSCASCHGQTGLGDGPQIMRDDDGQLTRPRDLTRGVYKGGGTKADLYARLVLGIPGTPMPASTTLKPDEVQDVLNYILSLAKKPEPPIRTVFP